MDAPKTEMGKTEATPEQRRRALASALALALIALAIYAVVIAKFFIYK